MATSTKNRGITNSRLLYDQAKKLTPGGVHSNVRWNNSETLYFNRGEGARIWDVDDNEYIDCIVNYGALILGHRDSDVINAVCKQLKSGLTAGIETSLSIDVAKMLTDMIPSAEMVRFANSGTEAVMHAIQMARGYTGKKKILKTEGNYHGWYDFVYCSHRYPREKWRTPESVPSTEGMTHSVQENTLVVPWNNIAELERIIDSHKDEIAVMILEPVNHNIGCALPKADYLKQVRKLTTKNNIVLAFDEVITGFRSAPGGAQEFFGIMPDISIFAKAVANGFSLSVVAGKKEIFDVIDPANGRVAFGGTYNGSQPVLAAAHACLSKLKTGEIQQHLKRMTDKLIDEFSKIRNKYSIEARLQGFGGKFQIYFTSNEVSDWRTASSCNTEIYERFRTLMLENGILWVASPFSHNGLTASHSEEDVDKILYAINSSFCKLSKGGK